MYEDVIIAGTGGQGILLFGNIIAEAALAEGSKVTFLPSYGVEMRGGNANCTVVISDREIGSPSIHTPKSVIAMSAKARMMNEPRVLPEGLMVLNTSLVSESEVERDDIRVIALPFNDIAAEMGSARLANMVALGVYVGATGVVDLSSLEAGMEAALSERNRKFIPQNMEAINKGVATARERSF